MTNRSEVPVFRFWQWRNVWFLIPVVLAGFVTLTGQALGAVQFKRFDFDSFSRSLTPLLVVALLIERAIEVFFGMWREPGDRAAAAKSSPDVRAKIAAGVRPEAADATLANRKAENTRIAFITNAIVSVGVSLAGVRILALIIEPCQPAWGCMDLTVVQKVPGWWQFTDVILTAGLLGGGASGFHELTQVLNAFMERARQGKPTAGSAGDGQPTTS